MTSRPALDVRSERSEIVADVTSVAAIVPTRDRSSATGMVGFGMGRGHGEEMTSF